MENKTALIVGATGLVGRQLLDVLLNNDYYNKIIIVGRRTVGLRDPRIEELIIDFDQFDKYRGQISANDYYCSIGTTMKQAGSKDTFMKIDHSYPIKLAQNAATDPLFEQFLLVSAAGANTESSLFYNEVKGKTEEALKSLNLKSLLIFRPSLLLGKRQSSRTFEEVAKIMCYFLGFFIIGSSLKKWAIESSDVANSMYMAAKQHLVKGVQVFKYQEMIELSESYAKPS